MTNISFMFLVAAVRVEHKVSATRRMVWRMYARWQAKVLPVLETAAFMSTVALRSSALRP